MGKPMTYEEIFKLMDERYLTIFQVIDAIIQSNGFGKKNLVDLENMVVKYIRAKGESIA